MANFDNIGEFALDQVLAKRFTTPGGSVAPTIAPELFGVVALENDRPEWGWLKGERYCSKQVFMAAVAGQFCSLQLYLPSTAREIAVVERIELITTSNVLIARSVGIGGGLGGWAAQTTAATDFRFTANATSCILETVTAVGAPARHPTIAQLATAPTVFDFPIVIAPGTALSISGAAVNTVLAVNLSWRERGAQPGELV